MQVGPLIAAQYPGSQTNDGPQMHGAVMLGGMFGQFVNLGVAIVARSNAIVGIGGDNLVQLFLTVSQPFILVRILQEAAATAAAVVVRHVWRHVHKVFFTNTGFHDIPQILGALVAKALPDDVTGVLNGELNFQVFVPVGIDLQFSFPEPFGVKGENTENFKVGSDFVFLQSGPDCERDVASLGVEEDFTPQFLSLPNGHLGEMFPGFVIGQEHAVILRGPTFAAVGPIIAFTDHMENFPQW
jgi:hypothetical protein